MDKSRALKELSAGSELLFVDSMKVEAGEAGKWLTGAHVALPGPDCV